MTEDTTSRSDNKKTEPPIVTPLTVFENPDTSEMEVTFPIQPCNAAACQEYITRLGGCDAICGRIYAADYFSGECKFGVRRRSLISFMSKWGWTRRLFCSKGKPHRFYNCGCDCKYFEETTPKRTYLAQYECWTCFGENGAFLEPAPVKTMKTYNFDDLVALNKRRGITVHFLGPKSYDIQASGITRPG
eukprot:564694_1